MFMILLAGLQGIPKNLIEAAKIDGLSWLQLILFIKIPYIKQLILFAMLLRITDAFKVLEVIFIMTFGGPGLATEVLSLHIYKIAFIGQQFGKAGALSLLFFTLSLFTSILLLKKKAFKNKKDKKNISFNLEYDLFCNYCSCDYINFNFF